MNDLWWWFIDLCLYWLAFYVPFKGYLITYLLGMNSDNNLMCGLKHTEILLYCQVTQKFIDTWNLKIYIFSCEHMFDRYMLIIINKQLCARKKNFLISDIHKFLWDLSDIYERIQQANIILTRWFLKVSFNEKPHLYPRFQYVWFYCTRFNLH